MAASANTVTNGTVHVFDYGDGEGLGSTVVLTGAIGDSGSADSIGANGTPQRRTAPRSILALVQGSFTISVVGLDKKIGSAFNNVGPTKHLLGLHDSHGVDADRGGLGHRGVHGHQRRLRPDVHVRADRAKVPKRKARGPVQHIEQRPLGCSGELVTGSGTVSF